MNRSVLRKHREEDYATVYHPVDRALLASTQLRQFKHHIFPGLNTHHESINTVVDIEDARQFYQKPPAVIRKPLPCVSADYVAEQAFPYNQDCVLKLVKGKLDWNTKETRWTKLARIALKDKKPLKNACALLRNDQPITSLPYIIAKLADHAARDPDEHFNGYFNWYYGNALAVTKIGDDSCLLFAGGEHLHKLCIAMYNRSSSSKVVPEVSPKINISLKDDNPIFDVVPSKRHGSIGVRQRDHCYFFLYADDPENVTINKCLTIERNEYPFVCMDVGDTEFCTIDANRSVKFWTPHVTKIITGLAQLPTHDSYLPDKFSQIKYCADGDFQTYAIVDRRKLYFYDKREGYLKPTSIKDPGNFMEMCEDISLLVPSLVDGYWYLGMTHTCLLYDARAGFVQKWTHMLPQAPSVGSIGRLNKESRAPKEYLLLATQVTNDVVAIYNKWSGENPKSDVLPINVPNRIDTLHEARVNGVLSDTSFTKKFTHALIGLAACKKKKRMGVFSLSSTGDVFHQCVLPCSSLFSWNADTNTTFNQAEIDHLKKWEADYVEQFKRKKPLIKISNLVDFSALADSVEFQSPELPEWSIPDLKGKASWKKSKKTLESYADFLAPHLLEDFGIYQESEWESENEDDFLAPSQLPETIGKVNNWLETITANPNIDENDIERLLNTDEPHDEEDDAQSLEISISSDESIGKASRMSISTRYDD